MNHWYENKKDLSDDEFALLAQTLIATGVTGFVKIDMFDNEINAEK